MDYIITTNKPFFQKIGEYNYCELSDMVLPNKISIDGETTNLHPINSKLFCCQIGTGENSYIIDFQDYANGKLGLQPKDLFCLLEGKELVFHNGAFDLMFFYDNDFYPKKVKDTLIASQILHNGDKNIHRHSFGFVMERELGLKFDKSEQKNINKIRLSNKKSIEYCFNDVRNLLELEENLAEKLKKYDSLKSYELNCQFIRAMAYMQFCGLPTSKELWDKKIIQDLENSKKAQLDIIEYIYDKLPKFREPQFDMFSQDKKLKVDLSSPKQMIPVFKEFGINVLNDEQKESIEETVINKSEHEFVSMWLKYKESEHRVTTFGDKISSQIENDYLYSSFNAIAETNRMISRKGNINFLNFPSDKETRKCFKAHNGYKMIDCDYESQEMVCLADMTQDINLIDNIVNKKDSHCKLARVIYPEIENLSDDEIKKLHKDKRQVAKVTNFSSAYGGNGYTISKNLNFSISEGERIFNLYKDLYKGIYTWGNGTLETSIKNGYILSGEDFKLKLPYYDDFLEMKKRIDSISREEWTKYKEGKLEFKEKEKDSSYQIKNENSLSFYLANRGIMSKYFKQKSEYFRLSLNAPSQSLAAHQSKRALANLFDFILENNHQNLCKISLLLYDEILLECKEELVPLYKEKLGEIMRDAANYFLKNGLTMNADAVIGETWADAK